MCSYWRHKNPTKCWRFLYHFREKRTEPNTLILTLLCPPWKRIVYRVRFWFLWWGEIGRITNNQSWIIIHANFDPGTYYVEDETQAGNITIDSIGVLTLQFQGKGSWVTKLASLVIQEKADSKGQIMPTCGHRRNPVRKKLYLRLGF